MNDTQLHAMSTATSGTWWWHPKPVAAMSAQPLSAAGTWWWRPKPVFDHTA